MGTLSRARVCTRVGVIAAALLIALAFAFTPQGSAQAADDSALTAGAQSALSTQSPSSITPGTYYIQTQLPGTYMLDLDGGSKSDGANVQIFGANSSKAQQWNISKTSKGDYTIRCIATGKYLDIDGAEMSNGTNVQQFTGNGTDAQRWTFEKNGTGYVIKSVADSSFALDVTGGNAANGTNVQIYTSNESDAQTWWLTPVSPKVASKKVLKNGVYEFRLTSAPSYVIASENNRVANGTNIELNERDASINQRWYVRWNKKGYYTIHNVSTGKVLDVEGDSPAVRANVQGWSTNNTSAQHWAISKNSDGSFTITCIATGLALEAEGAKAANGTNIQMAPKTSGASQRFTVKHYSYILPNGSYALYSMLAPLKSAVEIPNASKKNSVQAQLYSSNGNIAERFYLRRVSGYTYTIQSVCSGKYLTDVSGKVVQKKYTGKKKQQWTAAVDGGGLSFTNVASGKLITIDGGSATDGAKLVTNSKISKNSQRFHVVSTRLIPDGYYEFTNAASNLRLDVDGGSLIDTANVQVFKSNKTAAQNWYISHVGDGYYRILNDGSGKALDVTSGSKDAGANVWQYTYNKSNAQLWRPELRADGALTFVNAGSKMALEAAGTSNTDNVFQGAKISKATQGWYLTESISRSLSGNTELDGFIRTIVNDNDGDVQKCFDWLKSNVSQVDAITTTVPSKGIMSKQTTIDEALYVFKNKKADSYYYASAMKWLAIGCGYAAEARVGQVSSTTSSPYSHGWTEITSNGQAYLCDVDLALSIGGGYSWCMVSYDKAPMKYYL